MVAVVLHGMAEIWRVVSILSNSETLVTYSHAIVTSIVLFVFIMRIERAGYHIQYWYMYMEGKTSTPRHSSP